MLLTGMVFIAKKRRYFIFWLSNISKTTYGTVRVTIRLTTHSHNSKIYTVYIGSVSSYI